MSAYSTPDRCPACGAAQRAGAQWCTLCYADLRAPEPQPQPEPERAAEQLQADPSPVASDFALTAPVALLEPAALPAFPQPGVDPLTAPLAVVVGDESPTLGAETVDETWQPGGRVADLAWPCIRCGERNPMEAEACQSCAAPFGAGLATGAIKATERRRRNLRTAVIVGLALLLLAAITYFTTKRPPAENVDSRLPSEAPADPGVGEPLP